MKKLLFIPALIAFVTPVLGESMAEEQATACISENGSNQAALESCLSKLFVPVLSDVIQRNPDRLRSFGFVNPNDCVRLYQSISRYLHLWMDIAVQARDVYLPP
ncbi:MAG: hypothetical protein KDD43_15640, partial [Bdellovibrionales bacterium]|nr:hypothetical protein [Bdellovibrionales bacterium]